MGRLLEVHAEVGCDNECDSGGVEICMDLLYPVLLLLLCMFCVGTDAVLVILGINGGSGWASTCIVRFDNSAPGNNCWSAPAEILKSWRRQVGEQ